MASKIQQHLNSKNHRMTVCLLVCFFPAEIFVFVCIFFHSRYAILFVFSSTAEMLFCLFVLPPPRCCVCCGVCGCASWCGKRPRSSTRVASSAGPFTTSFFSPFSSTCLCELSFFFYVIGCRQLAHLVALGTIGSLTLAS